MTCISRFLAVAVLAAGLAGCLSAKPVSGSYAAAATTITLTELWSDVSDYTSGQTPNSKVLTRDGPLLNQLYVVSDLKPGQSIVRAASKEKPTPVLRADLSFNEQVEFVSDSVAALGYFRVETHDLRPQKFGNVDGLRFDFDAQTQEGLNMDGTALAAMSNGRFHLLMFLAPEEHYFAASKNRVEGILSSARLK
jgi:hypothetical protein